MNSTGQPVPRIAPIAPDQWSPEACDALAAFPKSFKFVMDGWNAGDHPDRGMNELGTLAHYPALARAFSTFNAQAAGSSTRQKGRASCREREFQSISISGG